jgi:hypothetical protein
MRDAATVFMANGDCSRVLISEDPSHHRDDKENEERSENILEKRNGRERKRSGAFIKKNGPLYSNLITISLRENSRFLDEFKQWFKRSRVTLQVVF